MRSDPEGGCVCLPHQSGTGAQWHLGDEQNSFQKLSGATAHFIGCMEAAFATSVHLNTQQKGCLYVTTTAWLKSKSSSAHLTMVPTFCALVAPWAGPHCKEACLPNTPLPAPCECKWVALLD